MTARTRDQAAARSLAVLTGAPYQSCLAAVPVLRRLPRETENDELAAVLAGGEPFRHLTVSVSDRAHVERAAKPPFASWLEPGSDVLFQHLNDQELMIFTSVVPPDIDLPETAILFVDDVCFSGLPRNGVWRTDWRAWRQACRAALRTDADDWAVDVAASRADSSLVPPDAPLDITFRHDLLRTAEPEEVVPGPGFSWLRLSLADIDGEVMSYAPQADRRSERTRGGAIAIEAIDALVVPDVLLQAWRTLVDVVPDDNHDQYFDWHGWGGGEEQPSWYGLMLPDSSILWLRVAPHGRAEAAPFVM